VFTEQTMNDSWLDRGFGWLISLGVHVALLLALTLVVVERYVHASGSVGVGIDCAIVERGPAIDRIDRLPDRFGSWPARPDLPPFMEDFLGERSQLAFFPSWSTSQAPSGGGCDWDDNRDFVQHHPISKLEPTHPPRHDPDRYRLFSCRCKATFCRLGTHCPVCHGPY